MATLLKLRRCRVQNYKSIQDTGWIAIDEFVTAFVGKNEAGKSAILKALYKLNPVDQESFIPVREFPRSRYTYEFNQEDWVVVSAEYSISQVLQQKIADTIDPQWKPTVVTIHKHYSGNRTYSFSPDYPQINLVGNSFIKWLTDTKKKIQRATISDKSYTEALQTLKETIGTSIDSWHTKATSIDDLFSTQGIALLKEVSDRFGQFLTEAWQNSILEPLLDELDTLNDRVKKGDPKTLAVKLVDEQLPVFIYFEDYGTLDDTLVIDRFIEEYRANPHDAKLRTKMALFRHINLLPDEVYQLGREHPDESETVIRDRKDERAIKLSSASRAMTQKFQGWWGQRRHTFEYRVDGNYFRVWVSDDKNNDPIELINRSRGLQWFFSFYLVFLVEAQDGHRNAILLLDEPGVHLHPTAQQDLLSYFDNLASQNQLIYSTHSPFMVDGKRFERVRVISEDDRGLTNVSDRIWPKDREATFPLQAALGYSLAQTLFQGKRCLIVEGLTDLWILKAMNSILQQMKRITLPEDVVITPAGGAKEITHFASLFLSNDVDIVTLFDGDQVGQRYAQELERGLFQGINQSIVLVTDAAGKNGIELEDLIPRDDYVKAVEISHSSILGSSGLIQFEADEIASTKVLSALEAYAKRNAMISSNGSRTIFDKGVTTRQLLEIWQSTEQDKFSPQLIDNFEYLFKLIRTAFNS